MRRRTRGNMLILVIAFLAIVLAILIFALGYAKMLGSNSEQKTAIEAAALAAARDMSKIVVNTDEFGYVGLSDSAPIGTSTAALDNYYTQVHSINTIIGTARLDMIMADATHVGVPEWTTLAQADLQRAKDVWTNQLEPALQGAIVSGGSAVDRDGKTIEPYLSAEKAYKDNQIRMSGSSNYVAGSLKLALGEVAGGTTNIPVPKPLSADSSINSTNSSSGSYKSYVNVPYKGTGFVFAGIGSAINLVDPKNWIAQVPGLAFHMPTIVRAEAVQNISDSFGTHNLKAAACAQPASVYDPKPAPGALTVSFPDGIPDDGKASFPPPPFLTLKHLYGPELSSNDDASDFYKSSSGDYPTDSGSNIAFDAPNYPLPSDSETLASNCCKVAVYDWLKRGGTKVNVDSAVGIHSTPFNENFGALGVPATSLWPIQFDAKQEEIPTGTMHIYRFDPDGVIWYDFDAIKPVPFSVVSENQTLVECHDALEKVAKKIKVTKMELDQPFQIKDGEAEITGDYDLYIRIYGRKPGAKGGGQHGGEPLDDPLVSYRNSGIKIDLVGNKALCSTSSYGRAAKKKGAKGKASNVGKGALPDIGPREDFMFIYDGVTGTWDIDRNKTKYKNFKSGSGIRPSYQINGVATDIRFRRVILAKKGLIGVLDDGYIVDKSVP